MKILIDNRTSLSNEDIGTIIDYLQEREKQSTQYYGKWKGYELKIENKHIKVETLVMKRYFKILLLEEENEK